MSKKKISLVAIISAAILVGGFFVWRAYSSDDDVTDRTDPVGQVTEDPELLLDPSTEVIEDDPGVTEAPEDPSKQKDPAPPTTTSVDEPPLVYTGYGHASDDPLPLNQETSTTCTTEPGVECRIVFTNENGNTKEFSSITTDAQGVAIWNWTGDEVGSGTWKVVAFAGDKNSAEEVIYIQ